MLNPTTISDAGAGNNQALRTALALSAVSGAPLRLRGLVDDNPRPRPGLGPGGLTTLAAASIITGGTFQGALGQTELEFNPGPPRPGDYSFDVSRQRPSDAPLSWVLEALLLPLSAAGGPSQLMLTGGTHVMGGPTSEMLSKVLVPNWRARGLEVHYTEISPGFHPSGGGEAEAQVDRAGLLQPLEAQAPFRAEEVGVEVVICGLPVHLAEQAQEAAMERLTLHGLKPRSRLRRPRAASQGLGLLIWARGGGLCVGFSALGRRGGQPMALALEAVEALVSFLKSQTGVPCGLAAILLAPLACAQGLSRLTVDRASQELKAACRVVEAFWPGTVRLTEHGGGGPVELWVKGRDWGRAL